MAATAIEESDARMRGVRVEEIGATIETAATSAAMIAIAGMTAIAERTATAGTIAAVIVTETTVGAAAGGTTTTSVVEGFWRSGRGGCSRAQGSQEDRLPLLGVCT